MAGRKIEGLKVIVTRTGEILDAEVTSPKRKGAGFVKVWQGKRWWGVIEKLQGTSVKVLMYLERIVSWENGVPGPSEMARELGMKRQQVSRAYGELIRAKILEKGPGGYRVNPSFCWRGEEEGYVRACRGMMEGPVGKQLVEANKG